MAKLNSMTGFRPFMGVLSLAGMLSATAGQAQPPRSSPPAENEEDPAPPRTRFAGDGDIEGLPLTEDLAAEELPPPPPPPPPDGLLPLGEVARLSFTPRDRPKTLFQGNSLIVVTNEGVVAGHDAVTGEFLWKLGLPGEPLMPPVALTGEDEQAPGSEVLISASTGHVLVLDAASGEIRREAHLPFELALPPLPGPLSVYFLATPSGAVVAYDLDLEKTGFRVETGEPPLAMALGAGILAVSGADHTLTAVNIGDGSIRWTFRGRGAFVAPASFDATGSRLYIGDDRGDFYCVDTEKGSRKFRWPTGAAIRNAALVEENTVFITSFGNNLYAYRAGNGHELWRANLPGRPATGALRLNGRLVVVMFDGVLLEVHPLTGRLDARHIAPAEIQRAPSFLLAQRPDDAPLTPEEVAALKAEGKKVPLQFWQVDESLPLPLGGMEEDAVDGAVSEPTEVTASATSTEIEDLLDPLGDVPDEEGETEPDDAVPEEPMWYERSRIALSLRNGEVLLLKHQHPVAPAIPEGEGLVDPSTDGGDPLTPATPSSPPKPREP